ncbi:MAG TPA: hypothetical protein VGI20_15725 [Rhizomicrobium sp.]
MQDELSRAQHYRTLAFNMRNAARDERDEGRRKELFDLAAQYENLADKLVVQHAGREAG